MKKLFTVVFTMLLAGTLAFGQTGGATKPDKAPAAAATSTPGASGKKATKKGHKGGKKSKKGSAGAQTPAPK